MPYREISQRAEEDAEKFEKKDSKKTNVVRGISWSFDKDLSNDGLSSNERIVKLMSRDNSDLLGKWVDAVKMKTGKADIARTVIKEFHKCGALHRQKADDMVKGLTTLFRRYESFKEKIEENAKGPSVRYKENGDLEFVNVSSFLQVYIEKNFPYYLDMTKAFDTLYRVRPDLKEDHQIAEAYNADSQSQTKAEAISSDEESSSEDIKEDQGDQQKRKSKRHVGRDRDILRLKKLKVEAEIKRFEAETKRIEFETHEKVLELHARYNEPRFVGTQESKAAELIFRTTFPSLYSQSTSLHDESEVDELEE